MHSLASAGLPGRLYILRGPLKRRPAARTHGHPASSLKGTTFFNEYARQLANIFMYFYIILYVCKL